MMATIALAVLTGLPAQPAGELKLTNVRTTVASNTVTLTWNAVTDNSGGSVQYEVLRDDPVLGTVVEGATYDRTWTDTNVAGTNRYFVRAVDPTGNRSATTTALTVAPPPPVLATLIPAGSTWSYRADGQNLGTVWRARTADTSGWPTGPSTTTWLRCSAFRAATTVVPPRTWKSRPVCQPLDHRRPCWPKRAVRRYLPTMGIWRLPVPRTIVVAAGVLEDWFAADCWANSCWACAAACSCA